MWIMTHRYLVCMKNPNLSMHHLLEHINQDIKRDKAKIRTKQRIELIPEAKEIQQVNPGVPDNSQSIRLLPSHQ